MCPAPYYDMTRPRLCPRSLFPLGAALLGFASNDAFAQHFVATPLGEPTGAISYTATRMSSDGHWVAGSATFKGGVTQPVVWHDSVPQIIPNLAGISGTAHDVNNSGLVVGQSNDRAFWYQDGTVRALMANDNWRSEAFGVNNEGYIVGQTGGWSGWGDQFRAVGWATPESVPFDIHFAAELPNGVAFTGYSGANDIADTGMVGGFVVPNTYVGTFSYNVSTGTHWRGLLIDTDCDIRAISNATSTDTQYTVGSRTWPFLRSQYVYRLSHDEVKHGYVNGTGQWHTASFFPMGVNSAGVYVGHINLSEAYIGRFGGTEHILDTLLVPDSGVNLHAATDINDNGAIVAHGEDAEGFVRAYLLVPVPHCPGDFNRDHDVDSQDYFDFLECFFGPPCLEADFNSDGLINSQDFFDFLAAFFVGC